MQRQQLSQHGFALPASDGGSESSEHTGDSTFFSRRSSAHTCLSPASEACCTASVSSSVLSKSGSNTSCSSARVCEGEINDEKIHTYNNNKVLIVCFVVHVLYTEFRKRHLHPVNAFTKVSEGNGWLRTGSPRWSDESDAELECHGHPWYQEDRNLRISEGGSKYSLGP